MQVQVIMFSPVLARVFDPLSALILQQVHFLTVNREPNAVGEKWVYNTYEQWEEQIQGWSARAIRLAMKNLENSGILVVGQFNKFGYDKTKWYRIDYQVLCTVLTESTGSMWQIQPHASGKKCHNHLAEYVVPIPETSPKKNHRHTETATSAGDPMQPQSESEKAIAKIKNRTPMSLQGLWKKRMATLYPAYAMKDLPVKDQSQLKQAAIKLGPQAMTYVDWALQNWDKFVMQVKKDCSGGMPEIPNAGYLYKYWATLLVAYGLYTDGVIKPSGVQSIAHAVLAEPDSPKGVLLEVQSIATDGEHVDVDPYLEGIMVKKVKAEKYQPSAEELAEQFAAFKKKE